MPVLTDTARLDFLINWLSHHDDLEGSGIRDWDNKRDARAAIDEAMAEARKIARASSAEGAQ